MRGKIAAAMLVLIAATACAGDSATDRTVRVDFRQDEFASHYWRFFPREIAAHPGDTIVFDQQWTGEPHTVTFGTLVDQSVPRVAQLERKYADVDESSPPEVLEQAEKEFDEAMGGVPSFDPYTEAGAVNWLQPCYLDEGKPPRDRNTPCKARAQPEFNGRRSYYSSGFISPSGPTGNTYRVPLADDVRPGRYQFVCIVHQDMEGRLVVRPKGADLPSPSEVNARALKEIERLASPLRAALAEARAGKARAYRGTPINLPMGGYHSADLYTVAIDEFVPKVIRTRVGDPVTWTLVGPHTVSFGVPRYVPIYTVGSDGTVRRNPKVDRAAGGSPPAPAVGFESGPLRIDGGTWDGSRFISSGLLGSEPFALYTLRFSKPGTYRYACLVHPPMVGRVVVER